MADCCRVVAAGAGDLGNFVADALGLAVGGRPAVHQGLFCVCEHLCGIFNGIIVSDFFQDPSSWCIRGRTIRSDDCECRNFSVPITHALLTSSSFLPSSETMTSRSSHSVPQNGHITSVMVLVMLFSPRTVSAQVRSQGGRAVRRDLHGHRGAFKRRHPR